MSAPERQRVVLVTGLSGAGKASALRALEDLGYEAVDNPPLQMIDEMIEPSERRLAIGIDARTRGFDADRIMETLERLRANPELRLELLYVLADDATLLRRYTETRRRHPLALQGRVIDGVNTEREITRRLRTGADLVIDTSNLPLAGLRRLIEQHFGVKGETNQNRMVVALVSFAYPRGLPPEADLVFDARFLRNPHYDPILQPRTGLDPSVGAYVAGDPDFETFFGRLTGLLEVVLPRFVQEGKKYATITIGCTGGRHRSVYLVERLAAHLAARIAADQATGGPGADWRLHVTHRELIREGQELAYPSDRPVLRRDTADNDEAPQSSSVQA
ncbi:MAG: RNase adapter RapZ [Acetobacteraceae bacterium]